MFFVTALGNNTVEQLKERIEFARAEFGGVKNQNITGVIVNKLNAPVDDQGRTRPDLSEIFDDSSKAIISNVDLKKPSKKTAHYLYWVAFHGTSI
ncbi:phosphate acetyltransferase domain protein [Proteus penneri ATCC 35198]|nr:phosphate acetyltransferase domain protein [Proteus penneri ATCC 35198]